MKLSSCNFRKFSYGLLFLFCCLTIPVLSVDSKNSPKNAPRGVILPDSALLNKAGAKQDSLAARIDTAVRKDTLAKKKKQSINEVVEYEAQDSLVFLAGGVGKLYGAGKVSYGKLKLDAGFIRMNTDSTMLYAIGRKDSAGKLIEKPVFKDESGEYESKEVTYNFNTGKGLISSVVTKQGEGYVVSGLTKKINKDELCMIDGKYTTCDNTEHPHFYLALSKAKVSPGKYMISGPAHLVIEDVNLPLYIPFGYFPFTKKYSSGILPPSYGDELSRGFYLKDGGYYFALNDYMDLALTGDLYSKGSWGVKARTSYRVRYKFSGSFDFSYLENVTGEKNLPDYSKSKNMSLTWSHSQDAKANPYRTFSANVNFATSGYTRNDLNSYYNPEAFANNTKSSSVNLSQRFADSPFSLNLSMNISQRSKDSVLSVSLPSLNVSMSTINPFRRKNPVGNERWYEKIRVGYTGTMANSISEVKEYEILKKSLIKDWKNGIQHNIPISATFNLLNYINLTPSINYTERWYSSSLKERYNEKTKSVETDTLWGFNRVWDYSAGVSASTKLYGMYQPIQKIFGDKVNMIRHVITPSVSFSYRPDFGSKRYGYYDNYSFTNDQGKIETVNYSRYSNSLYGTPSAGKSGMVGFNVSNNLEMKVKQVTDTSTFYKKVSLIDDLSFGTSYNMAADSLNWSDISASVRIKFGPKYTLNLAGSFDPYTYQLNSSGNPVKVDVSQFQKNHVLGKLTSTGTSFSYTISNETFKKKDKKSDSGGASGGSGNGNSGMNGNNPGPPASGGEGGDSGSGTENTKPKDPESALYQPFKMPWSLSLSYSITYGRSDFNKKRMEFNYDITQNLSLNGNIALGDKWRFTASTSYNFQYKEFSTMNCSVSRDLHCWEMSGNFIPIGRYKSYNFTIRVKSSMLQDLKYEQHQNPNDNTIWGN